MQIKTISLFSTLLSAQLTSYAGNKPSGVGGNYVLCARCAFVLGLDVFCSANCGKFDETALKFAYTYTQVISLEGWVDIMYFVQDAHSFWDWIYFVALIVVSRVAENARRKSSFYRENPPAQLLSSKTYYYYTQNVFYLGAKVKQSKNDKCAYACSCIFSEMHLFFFISILFSYYNFFLITILIKLLLFISLLFLTINVN